MPGSPFAIRVIESERISLRIEFGTCGCFSSPFLRDELPSMFNALCCKVRNSSVLQGRPRSRNGFCSNSFVDFIVNYPYWIPVTTEERTAEERNPIVVDFFRCAALSFERPALEIFLQMIWNIRILRIIGCNRLQMRSSTRMVRTRMSPL